MIAGDVTGTAIPVAARTPGAVEFTVVEPALIGSKATPPVDTDVGELLCPAAMVTVRVCPEPAVVVSWATAAFVWLMVTVTGGAPARSCWNAAMLPALFRTPMDT